MAIFKKNKKEETKKVSTQEDNLSLIHISEPTRP